jgi:4-amino-4-deoxy-L-arabinose transferase-like glycosyltransferase
MNFNPFYERLQKLASATLKHKIWLAGVAAGLFILVVLAHVYQIDSLPRGLYIDEVSIGLNAATLAENGQDEFATPLPLYFKAFGEYKNPVYIYVAGILFKIFGASDLMLRLASSLFFFILLASTVWLAYLMSEKRLWAVLYGLLSLGFLPQYFTMSRISFEVISHPALISVFLLLTFLTYEPKNESKIQIFNRFPNWLRVNFMPFLTGAVLGLSVYTYTTARLLTPLIFILLLLIYRQKTNFVKNLYFTAGFILAYIPWVVNFIQNPLSQVSRFGGITYLNNPDLNLAQKIWQFVYNYFSYFSPANLIISGDSNLRHSIGYGGVLFTGVLVAALVGLLVTLAKPDKPNSGFNWFILLGLLVTPLAATLTQEGTPHLLRSSLLGLYFVLLGTIGLNSLIQKKSYLLPAAVFLLLLIEMPNFLFTYFVRYPSVSVEAFGSFGYSRAVEMALAQNPEKILVSSSKNGWLSYALVDYYNYVITNPAQTPVRLGEMNYQPNTCFIYFKEDQENIQLMPKTSYVEYIREGELVFTRCYN